MNIPQVTHTVDPLGRPKITMDGICHKLVCALQNLLRYLYQMIHDITTLRTGFLIEEELLLHRHHKAPLVLASAEQFREEAAVVAVAMEAYLGQ